MGVHTVVFLVENFGEIGVPETHDGTQEENNKGNSNVAVIDRLSWFHGCWIRFDMTI